MKWKNIKEQLPTTLDDVLVSDNTGSYAVAWYSETTKTWHASTDLLQGSNYTGDYHITLDVDEIKSWTAITD